MPLLGDLGEPEFWEIGRDDSIPVSQTPRSMMDFHRAQSGLRNPVRNWARQSVSLQFRQSYLLRLSDAFIERSPPLSTSHSARQQVYQ
jgi:hypothetical protein